jgi:TP901 family phage tail tape measure protein
MANVVGRVPVGADTRPLENDISAALSKNYQLKGLNEKAFSQPLGRITGAVDEFRKSLDASNARVLAFGASAGAIFAIQKGFENLIKTTINVQKNLTDINSILGLSAKNLSNFGDQLFKVAGQTGQSFETVSQAAVEFSRQGLGVEETLKRTRDALILTRLSGLDVVSSTEALTATINSFNKVALDSTQIVNKLATVDAAFAVSSADLAQAIQRVGSSAESVGVNLDQLVALVTSVQQTTARGGAVIGNSLKTIFTRLERTDVLDQLEQLGIQARNLDGSFKPAIDTLSQLAQKFDGLSDSQRANVAELVGGVFQINILKAALGDLGKQYSIYGSALNTSSTATDAAVKRNEQLNQTLASLINKTSANFTKLAADVGGLTLGPAIEGVLGNVNAALESFNLADAKGPGEKLAKGLLEGLGNYISGPGLALIGAVIGKLFINLAKFSGQAVGQILDINKGSQEQAQIQERINSILAQNPNLIQGILNKQISLLEVENQILGVIKAQTMAREQAAAVSTTLTAGLIGRGVTSTGGKISAKSGGFIPNFSSPEQTEVYGAYLGGYRPGAVSRMNIPGAGQVVYNKAEQVKQFPGMSQPAIMPPQGSSAGKNYAEAFQNKLGFNPYAAMGYIPNFATASNAIIRQNEGRFKQIGDSKKFEIGNTGLTASKSEIEKALAAKSKTTSVLDASGIATMLVPHGGMTSPVGSYTFDNGLTVKWPVHTYGSRSDTGIRDVYQEIEKGVATGTIKYASSIKPPASVPNGPSVISAIKRTPGAAGALGAAAGAAFEVGMGLALGAESAAVEGVNFDVLSSNPELKKLFGYNTPLADFKINDSSAGNRKSMAEKIISASGVLGKQIFSGNQEDLASRQASVKQFVKSNNLNKSSGFIPNYSPLMQSIAREVSSGVSPGSVRVGQDSRLSNSQNPMGLGIYNTKDEPAGLSQGIARFKDIYSARTSGASKGYIPNYAFKDRLQSSALAASIGIPIAGGVAQQFIPEDNLTTRAKIGGVSNIASFAATGGAIGGLPGAVIGGLVGLVTTINDLDKAANQEGIDKFKKRLEQSQEQLNKLNDSFSQFNSITDKLRNSAGLSAADIDKLQKKLSSTLANIPEDLRSQLIDAYSNGDILKVQSIQTEAIETRQQEQKQLDYQTSYAQYKAPETLSEAISSMLGFQGAEGRVKGNNLTLTTGTTAVGKFDDKIKNISELVNAEFDKFNITERYAGETIDEYATRYENLVKQFIQDPKRLQAVAESTATQIEQAGLKSGNYGAALEQANQLRKNPELIIQSIKAGADAINLRKRQDDSKRFENVVNNYLNSIVNAISQTSIDFTNAETEIQINSRKLESTKNNVLQNAKLFFGEFTNIDIESQLNDASENLKYQADLLRENRSIREKLGPSIFADALSGLGGKTDTGTQNFAKIIKSASENIQQIPLDKLGDYLNNLIGQLNTYAESSITSNADTQKSAKDLINTLTRTQLSTLPESQAKVKQLQDLFNAEKEIRKQEIQQRLDFVKTLQTISFGGGLESLKRNDSRSRINLFNENKYLMGSQNPITAGRGALGLFEELKQFGIGPQSINENLKNKIVGGQASNLQKLASGFGINIDRQQAVDIATKQFDSISKTDQNVQAIKESFDKISSSGIEIGDASLNRINPSASNNITSSSTTASSSSMFLSPEARSSYAETIKFLQADQATTARQDLFDKYAKGGIDIGKIKISGENSILQLFKDQKIAIQEKYVGEQANNDLVKESAGEYDKILASALNYNDAIKFSNQYTSGLEIILSQVQDGEINILQAKQKINDLTEQTNIELERSNKFITDQRDHMRDLKDLADGYLTSTEYTSKELERQQNAARKQGYNPAIGIATNFVNQMSYNGTQFFQDLNTSAVDVARNIQESFSNAFQSFASGTVSAGDAFNNFAIQILQQIQQISTQISTKLFMGAIFNQFQGALGGGGGGLGSLLGFSRGGLVKGYAGGGYVNNGSGLVDDVPAVLSKGEFVLNQRAVKSLQQAYGPGFLHSLNAGATRGMADGGGFSKNFNNEFAVTGAENTSGLNTKDMQAGLNALDAYINQLKGENNVDPNLSNYALSDTESIKNQERMQKEVDYKDYVGYLLDSYNQNTATMVSAQQAYAKELDAYNRQQKQMLQSAWMSAIMGIAGGAMMGFGGGMGGGLLGPKASAFAMPGGMGGTSSALGSNYGAITSLYGGAQQSGGFSSLFSSKNLPMLGMLGAGTIGSPMLQNVLKGNGTSYASSSGRTSSGLTTSNRFRFASGGMAEDDVPALLMGGEFVVNKNAVKKYGTGFFEKLNNGQVRGFADGGQVGNSILGGGTESSLNVDILTTAIADLNETLKNQKDKQTSSAGDTNNITIQISMEADGKTTENSQDNSNSSDQNDENKNSNKAAKEKNMKEFTQLIKQNVISTIIEQKRPGGLLSKTSQS